MISSNLSIFFLFVALTIRNQSMMYQIPRPPPVSSLMIPLPQSPIRKRSKPKYPKKQENGQHTDRAFEMVFLLKIASFFRRKVEQSMDRNFIIRKFAFIGKKKFVYFICFHIILSIIVICGKYKVFSVSLDFDNH